MRVKEEIVLRRTERKLAQAAQRDRAAATRTLACSIGVRAGLAQLPKVWSEGRP
jgi:hypothetical protein